MSKSKRSTPPSHKPIDDDGLLIRPFDDDAFANDNTVRYGEEQDNCDE